MIKPAFYTFRLYLAGDTPNSTQARANLRAICRAHLPDCHKIEEVDVMREPNRALTDGIYMTPSLIKLGPSPVRMIVGTLSRTDSVLEAIGLGQASG